MPGLIGFVGQFDKRDAEKLLTDMAQAMKHQEWYHTDLYHGNSFGLGRVSLGLLNPEVQPIWNEERTLCIVMEGEIYDYQELKQKLINRGHCFLVNNDAEFILHLYEEFGEDFVAYLNGTFVAAIWNEGAGELVLVNDHLGLRPLYYTIHSGRFAFASGVCALLADPALPRSVDRVAIAQMLAYEYVLGNRTLLNEVQLLPPASFLTFRNGHFTVRPYWRLRFTEVYQKRREEEYLEGLIHYLRQAVTRQAPGNLPAGVNLSGGLDSRMLLGLLDDDLTKGSLHTFTFGIPDCDDARFARELAAVVGTRHRFFELKPDYLLELAEEAVRLTDGMESCLHVHALANLKVQAESVRILYTGYLVDSLISPDADRTWWAHYDDDTSLKLLFDDLNKSYLFSRNELAGLLTPEFQCQINGAFEESFRAVVAEAKAELIVDWQNNLELLQRQRRFTENGNELLRSQVIARTPFCDKDLVEYAMTIPPGLRFERYLFIEALARTCHELAKVPWDKTGFPLIGCSRDLLLRFDHQIRWGLRNAGLKWIPVIQRRSYVDYSHWMRTALRPWVEKTLLDKHTRERGYFNPDHIRKLVAEHMAGANHASKLGILLSLELWHKQFLD